MERLIITGKTLISTDWHIGIKNNSISRLGINANIFKKLGSAIKENHIDNFVFCGDMVHDRSKIYIDTLTFLSRSIKELSKLCRLYLIVGNHDSYNSNDTNLNALSIFEGYKNIHVISKNTEAEINGKLALFHPWCVKNTDLVDIPESSYDILFGHFDIGTDYISNAYIDDNKKKKTIDPEIKKIIDNDDFLSEIGTTVSRNIDSLINNVKASYLFGNWVKICRKGGYIFAGHIHQHREFMISGRNFIFIGSPYQQDFGEINSEDGYYILNEDGSNSFHKLDGIPVMCEIDVDNVIRVGIDNYDFSVITGNIVRKVYKAGTDSDILHKIDDKIKMFHPYDESNPEVGRTDDTVIDKDSVVPSLFNKSPSLYIKDHCDKIPDSKLEEYKITRDMVLKMHMSFIPEVKENN